MAIVKLLGELGRRFGREWNLEVRNPIQALQIIACQTPGFTEYLAESDENGIHWRVVTESPEGLSEDQLNHPIGTRGVLVIAPISTGSGGFGKILLGAVLIGAAFLVPGGFLGISSTTIGLFGGALFFGGVNQILSSKNDTDRTKNDSHLINSSGGTTNQGRAVALNYGEGIWTGFPVISAGVTVNQVAI